MARSKGFESDPIEELLVIEICAGSDRLTKTCQKLGMRGLAVDKSQSEAVAMT